MYINNLVVEVTRKCNMKCPHCLRGNTQNLNLNHKYIDLLLDQIDYINMLTFTGGEPSLNVTTIQYFLDVCKKKNITIDSFYIATNGKKVTKEFIFILIELFTYCEDKESCLVNYSNDDYHEKIPFYNLHMLKSLRFVSSKYSDSSRFRNNLINQGRCEWGDRNLDLYKVKYTEDFDNTEIYLNCKGQIISGCDWSYKNQKKNMLCKVENLTAFYNSLKEY